MDCVSSGGKQRSITFIGLFLFAFWLCAVNARAAESRPFTSGGLSAILKARQGQPFVLLLWSLECATCRKELNALADHRRRHPSVEFVFIATDDISQADAVEGILAEHGLGDVESWVFADANRPRLRYEIDPTWYGELPRNYFYDQTHERVGLSGMLKPEHLERWTAAVENAQLSSPPVTSSSF